jgi:hypothetical protein
VTGGTLVAVDAANVVGARPDGWWRDRPAAARRLRDRLDRIPPATFAGLPPPVDVVLVVEGAARHTAAADRVRVVAATGSGDDAIVELVRAATSDQRVCVVVTADRGLRERVLALGAEVRGPGWLYDLLADR